jgi:hypothetical protein
MKKLSTHAQAAKLIRQELKQQFPITKFSVTSKSYSGGNSIDVDWVDGPTTKAVETIINKYQYGHFNGMEDIYEYSNTRKDIPQVKFVFVHRTISDENYREAFYFAKFNFDDFKDVQTIESSIQGGDMCINGYEYLNRIFIKMDLTNGFNFEAFEKAT